MKKNFHILIITLIFAVGLFLSACSPKEAATNLTGKTWELVSYGNKPAITGIETNLVFNDDGTISGNVGCNSFSGNYRISGNEITFSQMISTMMACEESVMEQEYGILSALNGTLTFDMEGSALTLYAADGSSAVVLSAGQ